MQAHAITKKIAVTEFYDLLPDELKIIVLKLLDASSIKSVSCTSSKNHRFVSENILNTFYLRSLRFLYWQRNRLEQLEKQTKNFKDAYQITVFNKPQLNSFQKLKELVANIIIIVVVMAGLLGRTPYKELDNLDLVLALCGAVLIAYYMWFRPSIAVANNSYRSSLITPEQKSVLKSFTDNNIGFIDPKISSTFVAISNNQQLVTLLQLLDLLDQNLILAKNLTTEFKVYLESQRFLTARQLGKNEQEKLNFTDSKLLLFARTVDSIWSKAANKVSQGSQEEMDAAATSLSLFETVPKLGN